MSCNVFVNNCHNDFSINAAFLLNDLPSGIHGCTDLCRLQKKLEFSCDKRVNCVGEIRSTTAPTRETRILSYEHIFIYSFSVYSHISFQNNTSFRFEASNNHSSSIKRGELNLVIFEGNMKVWSGHSMLKLGWTVAVAELYSFSVNVFACTCGK